MSQGSHLASRNLYITLMKLPHVPHLPPKYLHLNSHYQPLTTKTFMKIKFIATDVSSSILEGQLDQKLTLTQKMGWGLADMGVVVFVIVKQLLVLSFLTNYLGVNVALAGVITTSVLVFDIVSDPIIGYLSDRTNTRWGRRAPWMVIGAFILAIGQIGIFGVPYFESETSILIWVASFFALSTLGFTMVAIPYGATAGEITYEPKERSALMGLSLIHI